MKLAILESMPSAPFGPSIANIKETPDTYSGNATVSFSGPAYDPEKTYSPVAVAQALEADGWTLLPCTRAKYGQWRRCMMSGTQESIPEERSRDKLMDSEPALPVWIDPNQFTPCDLECWMQSPAGGIYKVSIDVPHAASIHARRVERMGEWYFERGSAKLQYPADWATLHHGGQPFASIRDHYAHVDTAQGLSGRITWQLDAHEQEAFPLTLSQIMEALNLK